jgi:hypothetical protein
MLLLDKRGLLEPYAVSSASTGRPLGCPDGLFFIQPGVGSEDWSPDGFTRLK